jgi:glycosyltransferase involved in cell wall biosynthesis
MVGSRATWDQLAGYHDRCVYIPDNGVDPSRFREPRAAPAAAPLRVAFVGRLVPYKGADMLIEAAVPHIREGRLTVDIVGDGPQRASLERQVEVERVGDGVTLHGWIDHGRVQHLLSRCHVFGFPSIREFGGAVVLEAMAMGVVPVVVDYAGPAEHVTDATGYRVPLGSRPSIVSRFREILGGLAEDPAPLAAMRERARERVNALYTWEAKARQVVEVYRWVLRRRSKPEFGMPLPDVSLSRRADVQRLAP